LTPTEDVLLRSELTAVLSAVLVFVPAVFFFAKELAFGTDHDIKLLAVFIIIDFLTEAAFSSWAAPQSRLPMVTPAIIATATTPILNPLTFMLIFLNSACLCE
jgi:hypothetical protein